MKQTLSLLLLIWMVTLINLSGLHSDHGFELGIEAPGLCAIDCEDTSHHTHEIDCLWTVTQTSKWGIIRSHILISTLNFSNFTLPAFEKTGIAFLPLASHGRSPPLHLL